MKTRRALDDLFPRVSALSMYSEMFSDAQLKEGASPTINDGYIEFHSNPIMIFRTENMRPGKLDDHDSPAGDESWRNHLRHIMYKDTMEAEIDKWALSNTFALVPGVSYLGKELDQNKAYRLHAFVLDIDSVAEDGLAMIMHWVEKRWLPRPTYLVHSGTGLHVYLVLNEPAPLRKGSDRDKAKAMKDALSELFWSYGNISTLADVQYQPLFQGYRVPGSINEKYDEPTEVVAYRVGPKIELDELNSFFDNDDDDEEVQWRPNPNIDPIPVKSPEQIQLAKNVTEDLAAEAERMRKPRTEKLYQWWKSLIMKRGRSSYVKVGNRYWAMHSLVIFALKCKVPYHQVERDILDEVYPFIKEWVADFGNPLTENDVQAALMAYSRNEYRTTWETIKRRMGMTDYQNTTKRNGRTQADHLRRARALNDLENPDGAWRNRSGGTRHKDRQVAEWRLLNPFSTQTDCVRETGLSEDTVRKYWGDKTSVNELAIMHWRLNNPEGNKSECSRATGISRPTVTKYWNSSDE